MRHSYDKFERNRVDYFGPVLPAEKNKFFLNPEFDREKLGDYTEKTQHIFEEYWPLYRLPYLTFSSYMFGDLTRLDDKKILVVNREQFQHSDLFTDPVAFRSYA